MNIPQAITIHELITRHEAILLDAYGVLVNKEGPLPGALDLIAFLNRLGKPFYLVTNTAAHLPGHVVSRFKTFGLDFREEQIITAGLLLKPWFEENHLAGQRCAVLGPEDSFRYVEQAGAQAVHPTEDFDLLVIGDQVGYPFLDSIDAVLSRLIEKFDSGLEPRLVLPNPDLIYPRSGGFGITSGSVALILESALKQRYPGRPDIGFTVLGKPRPGLFRLALQRAGTKDAVMVGDQIATDIAGARSAGIHAAFLNQGVGGSSLDGLPQGHLPHYILQSLS